MSKIWASVQRLWNLSWWINQLDWDTHIDNTECVVCDWFSFEWNRLVTLKGYQEFSEISWDWNIKWLANIGEFVFIVTNTKVRIVKTTTWEVKDYTWLTLPATQYNVTIWRVFDYFIVLTDTTWANDLILFRFVPNATFASSTLTNITTSITWLTSKKFTCAWFYNGKMLLWWNPSNSALYFSKTATVSTENDIYNFNDLDASSQYIWDWMSWITWFKWGNDNFYIFKRDSTYQITSYQQNTHTDSTWQLILDSVAFITKRISNAGAINQQVIQQVEQDIIYFDWENIRRVSYETNNLAIKDASISEKIYPIIQLLPKNQSEATWLFVYPYYKLYLKSSSTWSNDIAFVYNVITKSWSTQSNVSVATAASSYYNKYEGYIWNRNSWMVWKDNQTYSQDWFDLVWTYISKSFDFWDNVDYKRITEVEFKWRISSWLRVFIDLYNWSEVVDTREIYFANWYQPTTWSTTAWVTTSWWIGNNEDDLLEYRERYEMYDDVRYYKFWIRFIWTWKFELHSHNTTYKFVKPYDIHY